MEDSRRSMCTSLCRVHRVETVRLLRDFDDSLFTTTPSEALEQEDRRLVKLNRETMTTWKVRKASSDVQQGSLISFSIETQGGALGSINLLPVHTDDLVESE